MEHIDKSRFAHVGESAHDREAIARPSLTFTQDAIRRLVKNRVALLCVILIILLSAMSAFAPLFSPFDYREQHYSHTNAKMFTVCDEEGTSGYGHMHLFGTDTLGRDIFSGIWYGGRISITIGFLATLISFFFHFSIKYQNLDYKLILRCP